MSSQRGGAGTPSAARHEKSLSVEQSHGEWAHGVHQWTMKYH